MTCFVDVLLKRKYMTVSLFQQCFTDAPSRPQIGEDRAAYRREGGPGADKKADVGAGASPNFQFVSDGCLFLFTIFMFQFSSSL